MHSNEVQIDQYFMWCSNCSLLPMYLLRSLRGSLTRTICGEKTRWNCHLCCCSLAAAFHHVAQPLTYLCTCPSDWSTALFCITNRRCCWSLWRQFRGGWLGTVTHCCLASVDGCPGQHWMIGRWEQRAPVIAEHLPQAFIRINSRTAIESWEIHPHLEMELNR